MSRLSKFVRLLVDFDLFVHPVGVHYRGKGAYKTRCGAFLTFLTYFLMLVNLIALIEAFFDGSNAEITGYSLKIDRFEEEPVNLAEK